MSDVVAVSNLLQIDRSTSFNPVAFLGKGWSIVEQDERAIALTEVDLSKVAFEKMLRSSETEIQCEEKLRRIKEMGHIRLDARVLQLLWEDTFLIPQEWMSECYIHFDGTVLRDPYGNCCVLFLYRSHREVDWCYHHRLLRHGCDVSTTSACLLS